MPRNNIFDFGTDTTAKRCGLILLTVSFISFVGLILYWNMAHGPFIYKTHSLKWHIAPIPDNDDHNAWFRFEQTRETHKLDKACLEEVKHRKTTKIDIFRSEGIYAEECVTDIIKDEPETVIKWNASSDRFFSSVAKKRLIPWIIGGLLGGLFLFSGFAEHLFLWARTGHWPINNEPKKVPAIKTGFCNAGRHFKTLFVISWIIASVGLLAWMFYEDWYNASAAYIGVMAKVGLFAALIWLCKKAWHRVKKN